MFSFKINQLSTVAYYMYEYVATTIRLLRESEGVSESVVVAVVGKPNNSSTASNNVGCGKNGFESVGGANCFIAVWY
jgi:hypothetical protein